MRSRAGARAEGARSAETRQGDGACARDGPSSNVARRCSLSLLGPLAAALDGLETVLIGIGCSERAAVRCAHLALASLALSAVLMTTWTFWRYPLTPPSFIAEPLVVSFEVEYTFASLSSGLLRAAGTSAFASMRALPSDPTLGPHLRRHLASLHRLVHSRRLRR